MGADLLIIGKDEGKRVTQLPGVHRCELVHRQGEKPLHVTGAPPDQPVIPRRERERIRLPFDLVRGNDIHVPGQHQAIAVCSGVLRSDCDDDVGLESVGAGVPGNPALSALEVVADEIGDGEVAVPADRVEGNQSLQQLDLRQ